MHKQFQLNVDKYIDNNNFLRLNQVQTKDERWLIMKKPKQFTFFDVLPGTSWESSEPLQQDELVSTDGKTYKKVKQFKLYASYFFLSDEIQEHARKSYTIITLLAEFGGLFTLVSKVFLTVGLFLNSRVQTSNLLNEMYYLKLSTEKKGYVGMWSKYRKFTPNLHELTFSKRDMLCEIKQTFLKVFCCTGKVDKHMCRTEKLFLKGLYKI